MYPLVNLVFVCGCVCLSQAEKLKTPKIDEDGLLDLIKTRVPPKAKGRVQSGKGGKKKSPPCMGAGRVVGGPKKVGECSVSTQEAVQGVDSGSKEGGVSEPSSIPVATVCESPSVASTSEEKHVREKRSPGQ